MMTGLNHLHSSLRWLLLVFLILSVVMAVVKFFKKENYTVLDDKIYLGTFILTHIQLLLGLVLYVGRGHLSGLLNNTAQVMETTILRFFAVEHITLMLLAIVVITLGRIRSKKATGHLKHRRIAITYGIGLLLILAAMPWPFRGLADGWI